MNNPVVGFTMVCMFVVVAGCAPNDQKVAEHVKAGITVLDSNIQVEVKKGVVTLSGTVMDEATKNAAESAVKEIKGVRSVVNHTTVMAQVAGAQPDADERLRTLIDSAFNSNHIQGVSFAISNGEVTLNGDVKKAELGKAVKLVNDCRPKRVINRLRVNKD